MKMWSGRFRQPLDPAFDQWQRSFAFDQRLLAFEIAASRAHARALAKIGILSQAELSAIVPALDVIGSDAGPGSRGSDLHDPGLHHEDAEDVHHFVEKRLVELIGEVGYKLHSGRSRNEQIATDLRLFARASIECIQQQICELLSVLCERADQAGDAVMPAQTHLQPAEPVLVAHWLLAYAEMLLRDSSRLSDCRARMNLCPLGSGAVAGAPIPLSRDAIAAELGFTAPNANSIDAVSDRDFAIEFVQSLAILATHLSRWAEEMILFSTPQFGFIALPESYSTGSSALPQKKNADSAELVRAQAARLIGNATTLLVTMKGLPLAYNKDLQETQLPLFAAADTIERLLPIVSGFMRDCEFDYQRMRAASETGFQNALAAAIYLVAKGVPFRKAHEQVAAAVRLCLDKKCELAELSLDELRCFGPFENDVFPALTTEAVLGLHNVTGGTAPARVKSAIANLREQIAALGGAQHACA